MTTSNYSWVLTLQRLNQPVQAVLYATNRAINSHSPTFGYHNDAAYTMSNLIEEQIMSSIWVEIADELLHP